MLIISTVVALLATAASPELASNTSPSAAFKRGQCLFELIAEACPNPNVGCDVVFESALCVATCEKPDGSDYRPVVVSTTERPINGQFDDWCERRARDLCDAAGAFLDNWCWGLEDD